MLRITLFILCALSIWTTYANVLSDDTAVRALADSVANKAAGCGDACKATTIRGGRGMLSTTIDYDMAGHGHVSVVCRRPYIAFGDVACEVAK